MVELSFDPASGVGLLFNDIKSQYLKSGKTEAEFIKEINNGYSSSTFMRVYTNDLAKIEAGEVFEMAYKHKSFHPYLVRYGYPLPIGMNDYKSETKIDDGLRSEIDQKVKRFTGEVKSAGLLPGTEKYIVELSHRLYDWGVKRLAFKGLCLQGQNDWEAMRDNCGVCVDTTAIMHYALERAGLNPQFVYVSRHEPTMDNYNRFSRIAVSDDDYIYPFHVLDGIPIPGTDRLLHVDVAQRTFDVNYKYGAVISTREFAANYLVNQIIEKLSGSAFQGAQALSDRCIEINASNVSCYDAKYTSLLALWVLNKGGNEKDWDDFFGLLRSNGADQNPLLKIEQIGYSITNAVVDGNANGLSNSVAILSGVVRQFKEQYPDDYASLAFLAAKSLQNTVSVLRSSQFPSNYPLNTDFREPLTATFV